MVQRKSSGDNQSVVVHQCLKIHDATALRRDRTVIHTEKVASQRRVS